jgi:hypothetical protein
VFQVVWSLKIQGLELNSRDPQPIRLKLVKQNAPQLFFTLECFVCTGSQEDSGIVQASFQLVTEVQICKMYYRIIVNVHRKSIVLAIDAGATYIICRPISVPKEQGSTIVDGPDPTFYLRKSKVFPLDESFRKKVLVIVFTAHK